jgi:glutamate N-acetyltransferase/amino-acid N-acetyltransferase
MAKKSYRTVNGGVVAARGFRCAAASCGVKTRPGALDVGMIVSDAPAVAAAMFTTNRFQAASVVLNRERIKERVSQGIVVNAGNANACTGRRGMADARRMTALAAELTGVSEKAFLNASTGIIGRPMPMKKIEAGIRSAAEGLGSTAKHGDDFSKAIMTTDTVAKTVAVEFMAGKSRVRIGGSTKGAGMIAPNMATMLCFLTTDAAISKPMLRKALQETVRLTFNCITVDGDCSTNDTIAVLANGAAGNPKIARRDASWNAFRDALLYVTAQLARLIVLDGEGASRFVEVMVTGARTDEDAGLVARKIANSPLVKCAINGGDPNWGRIVCAAGYAGAVVKPERTRLWINGVKLFEGGMPTRVAPSRLAACMKPKEIFIHLDLGIGKGEKRIWTCDFSREYVAINADYHT